MSNDTKHSKMSPEGTTPFKLVSRHAWRLSLTYLVTFAENGCRVLYPVTIGMAIDGLLARNLWSLAPLLLVWTTHLAIGLARHLYDTRVFTLIYSDLAERTVREQRQRGVSGETVAARVALSREIVDFFQVEAPAVVTSATLFAGAVVMLFTYDFLVGAMATLALIPISLANLWFVRRSYRLNGGLNNRLEREIGIVAARPLHEVARHFARVRRWRIRISNAEAATWGVIELAVMTLAAAVLIRLTSIGGVTAGGIYAVLAYVWDYYDGVNDLPNIVQNLARTADITERLTWQNNNEEQATDVTGSHSA